MFLKALRGTAYALLLAVNLQCTPQSFLDKRQTQDAASQKAEVTAGSEKMGIVLFPDYYVRKEADGQVIGVTDGFEVRRLRGSPSDELLFAGRQYDKGYEYSDNVYAVSLDGRFRIRQASARDWEQGERVKAEGEKLSTIETDPKEGAARISKNPIIDYKGKSFVRTGKAWASSGALVSPDGKWIAVFSHTTEIESTGPGLPGLGAGGRGEGELYIDVYSTGTGEKIMAGRAHHTGGQYPDKDFEDALWIESRYLVVPIHHIGRGESYFLGILSGK